MKRGDLKVEAELTEETGPAPAEAPAPPPAPRPQAQAGPARLVLDGKEVEIDRETTAIGRLHGSEVEVDDPGASRQHAEIRRDGSDYVLVDLGSTNGTLVNNSPVSQQVLQDGDRITIGRTVIEFRRS
jgi:pSer/pThr/pTyr-binding forkhead associated (FHA) protein